MEDLKWLAAYLITATASQDGKVGGPVQMATITPRDAHILTVSAVEEIVLGNLHSRRILGFVRNHLSHCDDCLREHASSTRTVEHKPELTEGNQMTDERFVALHSAIAGSYDGAVSLAKALQRFSDEELQSAHSYKQLVETELLGEIERRKQAHIDDAKHVAEGT